MTQAHIWVLLIDVVLAIIMALLGNEIRIIIDEMHETKAAASGQHDAATDPNLIPVQRLLSRCQRAEEDRELFDRIAHEFEMADMDRTTEWFPAVEGSDAG